MKEIIIGLGFGDEGKGLVTDWRCSLNKDATVIRYSGGHQAGHNVVIGDTSHIHSNFGSGTLRGNPTYWNCKTFDPVGYLNELKELKSKGVEPVIKINPMTPVTTIFDKIKNLLNDDENKHGSVGVGFGATIQREEDNYHLYFQDLMYPSILLEKLSLIMGYYDMTTMLKNRDEFIELCSSIPAKELINEKIDTERNIIAESSQGILLDMDYGFFPNVTRSRVGTQEINMYGSELFLVTRCYQTRHGNGYCSDVGCNPDNKNETNLDDGQQGIFKKRVLDLDMLNYAINIDKGIRDHSNRNLVITCLDQIENDFKVIKDGELMSFEKEKDFLHCVIYNLPYMSNVYLSHGPKATDITSYWGEN